MAASDVGVWDRDARAGLIRCDATMAGMFGLTDEEARQGVTQARYQEIVHPVDRLLFQEKAQLVRRHGGLMVFEYRINPAPGVERWVLSRGRFEPVRPGDLIAGGRGIALDVTEIKRHGHMQHQAVFFDYPASPQSPEKPFDHAAALALELHAEAVRLGQAVPGLEDSMKLALALLMQAGIAGDEG